MRPALLQRSLLRTAAVIPARIHPIRAFSIYSPRLEAAAPKTKTKAKTTSADGKPKAKKTAKPKAKPKPKAKAKPKPKPKVKKVKEEKKKKRGESGLVVCRVTLTHVLFPVDALNVSLPLGAL